MLLHNIFVIAILWVSISFIGSIICAGLAYDVGRSPLKWFLFGMCLGLASWILVIALALEFFVHGRRRNIQDKNQP